MINSKRSPEEEIVEEVPVEEEVVTPVPEVIPTFDHATPTGVIPAPLTVVAPENTGVDVHPVDGGPMFDVVSPTGKGG